MSHDIETRMCPDRTASATPVEPELLAEIGRLVARHRDTCLWSAPADFVPSDIATCRMALAGIERYGDRDAYVEARRLARCL